MRAMTVRQPWAWAIIHGGKDIENRSRNIAGQYRGLVAIHAGLQDDPAGLKVPQSLPSARMAKRRGVVLGVVELVGAHKNDPNSLLCDGCSSRWAQTDAGVHLVLANARPLRNPIQCRGALGLWTPDADLVRRIEAQL